MTPTAQTVVEHVTADITTLTVDAIVNAANSSLMGGGGVCGRIFEKAGWREMSDACDAWIEQGGRVFTSEAIATPGFHLPARYVIHAVGPKWGMENGDEPVLLDKTYRSILRLADSLDLKSVAIPGISTGIYGFPKTDAAFIRDASVASWLEEHPNTCLERIVHVAYDPPPRPNMSFSMPERGPRGEQFSFTLDYGDDDDWGHVGGWSRGGTRIRSYPTSEQLQRFVPVR